ncbi:MAG TPA: SusC/RagA family TonB-linked outer membrane protein [Prevotella sp.]|nr:SusC/RagA family TonB-linked outer membrane protein [Prevotella sp.]
MKDEKRHKKVVCLAFFFVIAANVFGQNFKISGKVFDTDAITPLIGVTVRQQGEKNGAITDSDGNFTINIEGKNPILTFSYLSYNTTTVAIRNKKSIEVILKPSDKNLNEVVVTALGIKREEKSLGYSVTKISNKELTKNVTGNWLEQMNGKVAGLSLQQAGTGPLSTMRVTLRGDHSLNHGNSEALFVVDGVPIQSGTIATGSGSTYANSDAPVDFGNGASDINPDDVESVTVLKGAAATALYGSQAGNGAIIITTKGGENSKKWGVTLNSSLVFDVASYWPDFQTEYGSGSDMGLNEFCFWPLTTEQAPDGIATSPNISRYAFGEKYDANKLRYQYASKNWDTNTYTKLPWVYADDWYKGFFQTGTTLRNNVAINGGNGKGTTARFSFTDTRNNWIMPNTGYVNDDVAIAFDAPVNKHIKLSSRINYTNKRSDNLPATGYSAQNPLYTLTMGYTNNPIHLWKEEYFQGRFNSENFGADGTDGHSLVYRSDNSLNPYRTVYEEKNSMDKNRVYGNMSAFIDLEKGLTLKLCSSLDMTHLWRTQQKPFLTSGYMQGFYREQTANIYYTNNDFLLTYSNNKWFNGHLEFSTSFGGNSMNYNYYNDRISLEKLQIDGIYNIYNVPSGYSPDDFSYHSKKKVNSLYGITSLSWDDTYYLELTDRNDWSSALSKGNRSYNYPSVSTSILLDQLFHFDKHAAWIDMLKFKLSWANVGNDTSPYSLDRYYNATSYYGGYSISPNIPNANIKPENEESWEGGVEGKMFRGRIGFDFTAYTISTTNQIVSVAADQITGATGYTINAGKISSKGLEISFNAVPVRTHNFEWSVNLNWSKIWNKLDKLQDNWNSNEPYQTDMGTTIGNRVYIYSYVGHQMYHIYGYGYKRAPEGSYYLDSNGSKIDCSGAKIINSSGYPVLDTSNLIDLGKVNPDWTGGFSTAFRYKNWNLSMDFSAQVGGHCYSVTNFALSYQGKLKNSLIGRYDGFVVNGVQATSQNGIYTKNSTVFTSAETYYNSYVWNRNNAEENTFRTDFLKLRQVRLDFIVPKRLCRGTKFLEDASIGVYATNIFCITPFPQYDPETAMVNNADIYSGIETMSYPMTRSYGINIKLSF